MWNVGLCVKKQRLKGEYMVILDLFGKIEEIVISKKLGIIISNLPQDWQEDIVETIEDEIKKWQLKYKKTDKINLKKICRLRFNNYFMSDKSDQELLEQISCYMVGIQTLDSDESMLKIKNDCIDSPTCEKEFCEKLVDFLNFIISHQDKEKNCNLYCPTWIYSSQRSGFEETRVLEYLSFDPPKIAELITNRQKKIYNKQKIKDLIRFGQMVDNYLETESDFWKLDYIINSVFDDNNYNAYHLFKVVSLLEMLLVYPNDKGKLIELDTKLPQFLPEQVQEDKRIRFCVLVRQIRNKIGHGDFHAMNQKCEEFAIEFMLDYWFDYYELSRQNWILSNICSTLNHTLANVLWMMINDKNELTNIQMSNVYIENN